MEQNRKEITEGRSDPSNNEVLTMSIGNLDLKGEFYDEMLRNPIDHDYEVEFNEFQNSKEIITTLEWGRWKANIQRFGMMS